MLLGALINGSVTSENATFNNLLSLALTIRLDPQRFAYDPSTHLSGTKPSRVLSHVLKSIGFRSSSLDLQPYLADLLASPRSPGELQSWQAHLRLKTKNLTIQLPPTSRTPQILSLKETRRSRIAETRIPKTPPAPRQQRDDASAQLA